MNLDKLISKGQSIQPTTKPFAQLGLDQFICEISVYTWDPGTEAARLAHKKTNPKFDASEVHHTEWIARSTDGGLTWKRERST